MKIPFKVFWSFFISSCFRELKMFVSRVRIGCVPWGSLSLCLTIVTVFAGLKMFWPFNNFSGDLKFFLDHFEQSFYTGSRCEHFRNKISYFIQRKNCNFLQKMICEEYTYFRSLWRKCTKRCQQIMLLLFSIHSCSKLHTCANYLLIS